MKRGLIDIPDIHANFIHTLSMNLSVLGRSGERTLGARLIRMAEQAAENPDGAINRNLTLEVKRRIRLDGIELENYRAKKRAEEREATRMRYL